MTCVICRCIPGSAHFYSLLRRGRTLTIRNADFETFYLAARVTQQG
jgi:hypothetical protein